MSTTVAPTWPMKKYNDAWGACIRKLLETRNLSFRGAELKAKGVVSRTYIAEWASGKLPQYDTAVAFLAHFPREEAIECLKAAAFPIPADWGPEEEEIVIEAFRGARTEEARQRMIEAMREILEEEKRAGGEIDD